MKRRLIAVLVLANVAVFGNWLLTSGDRIQEVAMLASQELLQAVRSQRRGLELMVVDSNRREGKAVVGFFNDIAPTCASGRTLELLSAAAARHPEISFLAVLRRTFTESDAENLAVNWKLVFPVRRAGPDLDRSWAGIADRYGDPATNAFVVLLDGERLSLVHGTGRLEEELKRWVDEG